MKQLIHLSAAALAVWCIAGYAQSIDPAAAGTPAAISGVQTGEVVFADALQLYRHGRFSAAYGRFAQLADTGHVESARIALVMLRHGPDLYDADWTATPAQLAAWERMVGGTAPLQLAYHAE
jgi:hypothetical protein